MQSTPPPPNPSGSNYRETFAYLCSMLPKSPHDTPDVRAVRNMGAMDAVAALNPADAFEARLAARIVAMDAHAADALRSASLAVNDPAEMHRCRAQAASMSRQSNAALRALLRMQETHGKQMAETHPAAMERAGYWFQIVPSNYNWLIAYNPAVPKTAQKRGNRGRLRHSRRRLHPAGSDLEPRSRHTRSLRTQRAP